MTMLSSSQMEERCRLQRARSLLDEMRRAVADRPRRAHRHGGDQQPGSRRPYQVGVRPTPRRSRGGAGHGWGGNDQHTAQSHHLQPPPATPPPRRHHQRPRAVAASSKRAIVPCISGQQPFFPPIRLVGDRACGPCKHHQRRSRRAHGGEIGACREDGASIARCRRRGGWATGDADRRRARDWENSHSTGPVQ